MTPEAASCNQSNYKEMKHTCLHLAGVDAIQHPCQLSIFFSRPKPAARTQSSLAQEVVQVLGRQGRTLSAEGTAASAQLLDASPAIYWTVSHL